VDGITPVAGASRSGMRICPPHAGHWPCLPANPSATRKRLPQEQVSSMGIGHSHDAVLCETPGFAAILPATRPFPTPSFPFLPRIGTSSWMVRQTRRTSNDEQESKKCLRVFPDRLSLEPGGGQLKEA
jgi:hypothetical protein